MFNIKQINKFIKKIIVLTMMIVIISSLCSCSNVNFEPINIPKILLEQWRPNTSTSMDNFFNDRDELYTEADRSKINVFYMFAYDTKNKNEVVYNIDDFVLYERQDVEDEIKIDILLMESVDGQVKLGKGDTKPNAKLTLRGENSRRLPYKNYQIDLKKATGSWNGQTILNFNKHYNDDLKITNKLYFDYISMVPDMISLQTSFVQLFVGDESSIKTQKFDDYGMYINVEQPNKVFLKNHG